MNLEGSCTISTVAIFLSVATFVAELLVAWVIYLEVDHSRTVTFLERATRFEANENRQLIYEAYLNIPATASLSDRSEAFKQLMMGDEELKKACDKQLALFNDLGLTCRRKWFRENPLVSLLPHAAIYLWIILHPYIKKRRRNSGEWFAKPYLEFTHRCVKYALKHGHGLHLGRANGEDGLRISLLEVRKIEGEIREELKLNLQEPAQA